MDENESIVNKKSSSILSKLGKLFLGFWSIIYIAAYFSGFGPIGLLGPFIETINVPPFYGLLAFPRDLIYLFLGIIGLISIRYIKRSLIWTSFWYVIVAWSAFSSLFVYIPQNLDIIGLTPYSFSLILTPWLDIALILLAVYFVRYANNYKRIFKKDFIPAFFLLLVAFSYIAHTSIYGGDFLGIFWVDADPLAIARICNGNDCYADFRAPDPALQNGRAFACSSSC